jgi:hypothetical protein
MKRLLILTIALGPLRAQHHHDDSLNWKYNDQETIHRSFTVAGADRKLTIDNVSGYIHITGTDGSQVEVNVVRHNRAESQDKLETAKRQVKLQISQQGNTVDIFEDGPFRNSNDGINYRGDDHYGYVAVFDYDVQVPRDIELVLKDFNHGDIDVKATSGKFTVREFNGGIVMDQVAGAGNIRSFNGPVKVTFVGNPERDLDVETFNGAVDLYFPPGLNADLRFKTFNGGVYSDFEVMAVPVSASGRIDRARYVYRSGRDGSGRIGKGGPSLSFKTFNGPIRLHAKNQ